MPDKEHARSDRDDADRRLGADEDHDPRRSGAGDESRTWSSEDERNDRGRGADTPYGRLNTGSQNRPDAGWTGGGYGDQGGFGSQHGQGGYASPAQGSRYGQTGSEWGRSGYGSESSHREPGRYGGGESAGFGATSYAAERDSHEHRSDGAQRDYGFRGQGGGGAQWGGRDSQGEGGYGSGGGTYGQQDYGRSAQRSQFRTDQNAGSEAGRGGGFVGDPRGQSAASGHDDDHEPHYRRWRDQQLESHDRDYARWRTSQAKRYDDEYKSYRDQRHDTFSREFGDWRSKSGAGGEDAAQATPRSAQTAPAPKPAAAPTGAAPLTAADDSLRNVSDGGSRHSDHDKDENEKTDKA